MVESLGCWLYSYEKARLIATYFILVSYLFAVAGFFSALLYVHVIRSTYVDNWVPILLLSGHLEFIYSFFVRSILIEPSG